MNLCFSIRPLLNTDYHHPGCKSQNHGLRGRYQLFKTNPLLFVDLVSILASTIFVLKLAASDEVVLHLYLNLDPKPTGFGENYR